MLTGEINIVSGDAKLRLGVTDDTYTGWTGTSYVWSEHTNGRLSLGAGNAEKMSILPGGNVGIGTTDPSVLLDVAGAVEIDDGLNWGIGQTPTGRLGWGTGYVYVGATSASTDTYIYAGGDVRMTVQSDGDVGIGITNPSYDLQVNGTAGKTGGGSWSDPSDRRLKQEIESIDGKLALEKFKQLQGVTFEGINPEMHKAGRDASVIAQNLEEVFPDWVDENTPYGEDADLVGEGETIKTIHFPHAYNAYMIEALKEVDRKVEENIAMFKLMQEGVKSNSRAIASLEEENRKLRQEVETLKEINRSFEERLKLIESRLLDA
jgi:hypothetical protein